MKFAIFFLCVIVAVSAQKLDPKEMIVIVGHFNKCKAQTGAKIVLTDMLGGKLNDDPASKELYFCMGKALGLINEAGDFQEANIRKHFSKMGDPAKAEALYQRCAVKKATPQDTAYYAMTCVAESLLE